MKKKPYVHPRYRTPEERERVYRPRNKGAVPISLKQKEAINNLIEALKKNPRSKGFAEWAEKNRPMSMQRASDLIKKMLSIIKENNKKKRRRRRY